MTSKCYLDFVDMPFWTFVPFFERFVIDIGTIFRGLSNTCSSRESGDSSGATGTSCTSDEVVNETFQ